MPWLAEVHHGLEKCNDGNIFLSQSFLIVLYGSHKFLYERLANFNLVPTLLPSGCRVGRGTPASPSPASPRPASPRLPRRRHWRVTSGTGVLCHVSNTPYKTLLFLARYKQHDTNFTGRTMPYRLNSSEEMSPQSSYPQGCCHANSLRYWPCSEQTYRINHRHSLGDPSCWSDNFPKPAQWFRPSLCAN